MRQIVCEKNDSPLAPPTAPKAIKGFEGELDLTRVRGERPGSCTCSAFQAKSSLFSVLPTATVTLSIPYIEEVQKIENHFLYGCNAL